MLLGCLMHVFKSVLNTLPVIAFVFSGIAAGALDLGKIDSKDFIGGNPYLRPVKGETTKSKPSHPSAYSSIESRYQGSSPEQGVDSQIQKFKTNETNLVRKYRGTTHEGALDRQIANYGESAKENERVFGAPYRKSADKNRTPPKNILDMKLKELLESGVLTIITDETGKRKIVDNRRQDTCRKFHTNYISLYSID